MPRVKPAGVSESAFSARLLHSAPERDLAPAMARIEASARGLVIEDRLVPRDRIRAGFLLRGPELAVVVQGPRAEKIFVESPEQGRDLLRALELDVTQRVASFTSPAPVAPRIAVVAAVALLLAANLAYLVPLALVALVLFMVAPRSVDVGADGVSIRRLGRDRFIPFTAIDSVMRASFAARDRRQDAVSVLLRSGEDVRLHVGLKGVSPNDASALFVERVREGMESDVRGDTLSDAARLRRGDRDVATWAQALRSLGAGANADMRTAPMPRERLLRIVEDPAEDAADRAAAAVALGPELDERGRARLREIAAATAATKLRVAIDAVVDDAPAEKLHEALGALDELENEDDPASRASRARRDAPG